MLLLMVEADLHQRCNRGQPVVGEFVKKLHRRSIDMAAIGCDLIDARSGQVPALMAGMARAGTHIIGIEQEGVVGMKGLISRPMFAEQELLKKPGGMGAMPLRGAR